MSKTCHNALCKLATCTCPRRPSECPECGREMRAVTARDPKKAWRCDYCASTWTETTKDEVKHERQ